MSQVSQASPPNFAVDQGLEYYAGKSELLDWVNRLLDLNLVRLEQLTSGAVYCQVLDAFYADAVAIKKVNFLAREEYEILPNYKVLQAAFNALGFTKELNVAKLSQASTSDLMEFAQWLYKSFKGVAMLPGYNPAARREMSKGPSNSIPFPACCMNGSFDFGRSDLRVSGLWAAATPQEPAKALPRTQRPVSSTPASGSKPSTSEKASGGSSVKRSMPNLNVASRYREGLAVPPEHYQRSSPRLSPNSVGPRLPPVPVREGGTQTDFADEEYRPMTVDDVGTETAPPRPSRRDQGEQYEYGFGYGNSGRGVSGSDGSGVDGPSPSGSLPGASEKPNGQPRSQLEDTFSFGQISPAGATGTAFGARELSASGTGPPHAHPKAVAGPEPGDASGTANKEAQHTSTSDAVTDMDTDDQRRAASGSGAAAASPQRSGEAHAGGVADGAASTPAVEDGFAGFSTPAADPHAGAASASRSSLDDQAGGRAGQDQAHSTAFGAQHASLAAAPGALLRPGPGLASPVRVGPSPGASGGVGTPGTPPALVAALRRSAAGGLPADVASLLASPGPRHRAASAASLRNMAAALDVSAAALAAVHKSLDSFTTLLGHAAAGAAGAGAASHADGAGLTVAEGSGGGAAGASGSGESGWASSAALCGKARSLQDALQTVLAHTTLLLTDVQSYSEATQPAPSTPSSRLTSPRMSSPRTASPATPKGGAPLTGAEAESSASPTASGPPASEGGQRDCLAEATALLELARSHEGRLQPLMQQASQVLQLPPECDQPGHGHSGQADSAAASPPSAPAASAIVSPDASAASPMSATASQHHLTAEQRRLCSTAHLDSHLKAVGAAQFALVQGIHKEMIEVTSSYFRSAGGVADASTSGDIGAAVGGAAAVSRKARVFKLGEFQLKQLRNGDVYKGRYISNKKNGEGVYYFINGDVYEGEFRDDRMDGHGVYTFSHEGRYEGQWRNAVYNGTGAETFAKGSTYRGEYAGGLRNGWGVCRFYNGDYYEGQWSKGQRDGSGMQQCTDDSNFVGDYHRGKRHGHGVYSFPNGDRYEGQYCEDLPHGYGTYYFASGQCYQGQWQQGKKHGWSVYTVDNGSRFMGLWSQGKPTWVQPLHGDATAAAEPSEDDERSLSQALEARDLAVKAADEAQQRATSHWDARGPIQAHVQSALSRAHASAAQAEAARRKACDLAARLDAAVALLQTQGAMPPAASAATP